jgi:hypothetical protein
MRFGSKYYMNIGHNSADAAELAHVQDFLGRVENRRIFFPWREVAFLTDWAYVGNPLTLF